MRYTSIALILLAAAAPAAIADTSHPKKLEVTSPAFTSNGAIPSEYTCDGAGVSPRLEWTGVPAETRSIAVLVEDPDTAKGTVTHWLVTGIPASTRALDRDATLPVGAVAEANVKGTRGYAGPCPPTGQHHYHFHVFALDTAAIDATTRTELWSSMVGHVLAQGDLVGVYQKHH